MRCGSCNAELNSEEVQRYGKEARDFEAWEWELWAGLPPLEDDEDSAIPETVAPPSEHVTMDADGQISLPASWSQPHCDRCCVGWCLDNALYGWSGEDAYTLMRFYREGSHGCPQSP